MLRFVINAIAGFLAGLLAFALFVLAVCAVWVINAEWDVAPSADELGLKILPFLVAGIVGLLLAKILGARLWLLPVAIGWACGTVLNPSFLWIGYVSTGVAAIWLTDMYRRKRQLRLAPDADEGWSDQC